MLTIRNAIYIPKHVTKIDLTTISAVNKLGHDRIDIMKCSYKPMKHAVKSLALSNEALYFFSQVNQQDLVIQYKTTFCH